MADTRPGFKQALVNRAGIKIEPVCVGHPGSVCTKFRVRVTKTNKRGQEIEQKGKNPFQTYPEKGEGNIYDKIETIYDYYYKKLKTK